MPSRRYGLLLGGLIIVSACLWTGGVTGSYAIAAEPGMVSPGALSVPLASAQATPESEIADLVVVPIDETWDGNRVLRSRPLILDWGQNPVFTIAPSREMMGEDQARAELAAFLEMRGLGAVNVQAVMDRFDDPDIISVISAPPLRAALLMLSGLEPYQSVIDSLIDGENATGMPFDSVEFADLGVANAVATIRSPSPETNGRFLMQISIAFAGEPPLQLLPALIHESLHGDGENSGAEELAANILDTVAYGELLMIDPSAAYDGTQLTAYNNLQLYALLNSMGSRGGGQVGIQTSVSGDVFVGPGLEAFDARSIRDSILQDPFYGSLGASASSISPVAAELLERFPGDAALGATPHFDEALLALIDRGVSHVITPEAALKLAMTLGLSATAASGESAGPLRPATLLDLTSRPFVPIIPSLFDLNNSNRPANPTDERSVRLSLSQAIATHAPSTVVQAETLALFDDRQIEALFPENQIRAALVLISALDPWSDLTSAVTEGAAGASPWRIEFAPLPLPVNAIYEPSFGGSPRVLINEYLIGDSLEVTAAAIIEGILLESDQRTPNTTTVAALLLTVAYASMLESSPATSGPLTWGTINRNVDILALLNSAPWEVNSPGSAAQKVGFLSSAAGVTDVLPGLPLDAVSFQAHVSNSARTEGVDGLQISVPSELLLDVAGDSGAPFVDSSSSAIIDQTAMLRLDAQVSALMPPDLIASLLIALDLGVIA